MEQTFTIVFLSGPVSIAYEGIWRLEGNSSSKKESAVRLKNVS